MKKLAPILLLIMFYSVLHSQYSFQKILTIPYGSRPEQVKIRHENDGVYGPKYFSVVSNYFYILDSENGKLKTFEESGSLVSSADVSFDATSFSVNKNGDIGLNFPETGILAEYRDKENPINFGKGVSTIFRKSAHSFIFRNGTYECEIKSKMKIASVRYLNQDKHYNFYFDVESFLQEIPCKVKREVYVIGKYGDLRTRIVIPQIYYAYLPHDLEVDEDGNIFHLVANRDSLELVKWLPDRSAEVGNDSEINYPHGYEKVFHYNSQTTEPESTSETVPYNLNKVMVDRDESLVIADTYYKLEWTCQPVNKSNGLVLASGGKYIRTPDWIVIGNNKQMPYKWGGFSTLNDFLSGVSGGKFAGDNNCTGSGSSAVVGVDCSGFVSRCWKLSSHYATSMMPGIINQYSSWFDLKKGDAIHKVGHVRLCVGHNNNGTLRVIEASGVDWRVSYRDYSYNNLTGYAPYKFKNMIDPVNNVSFEKTADQFTVKSYPNPFNGKINFIINSPSDRKARFEIYDSFGRLVTGSEIEINSGENSFSWNSTGFDGVPVSSGVYYYRIRDRENKNIFINKILLIR